MIHKVSLTQNLTWHFIHPITLDTIYLGEKGTVQERLFENAYLPDPFYGTNEEKYLWIENHDWTFESTFTLNDEILSNQFIKLYFPSIDTYGKIYLNNHLIATTENAFHPHQFEVKKHLKTGTNVIKVIITPPTLFHKDKMLSYPTKYPAPNDVGEIKVAPLTRKPQYHFGWDWALRMNTIGFWKPAKIVAYNTNKIKQIQVETLACSDELADLKMACYLNQSNLETYHIESQFIGKRSIKNENGTLTFNFSVLNPKKWYPKDHGDQYLYEDTLMIYNNKNELVDKKHFYFGIRTTELIQEKDQWGTSFYFKINGEKVFAKGGNIIPLDVFPSRVTDDQIDSLISNCSNSNFNMLRVWGGGYYQDDIFYRLCAEKGIMVWQDFMFACAMYPGDEHFLNLVSKELDYQIPRISSHPSVVYFNGNNEVDVAWKNWGFQITYLLGPKSQKIIEEDYKKLFQDLIPKKIHQFTSIPYVHTSPLSNWGKSEGFNHGTMHYWGVWHGKDPIEDFGNKTGRFNAEYGFQSFPEYSTLAQFSDEKDWDLKSEVMKHHQKSYVGNGMIKKHADDLYGSSKDFKEFVYLSQLTQAKAVSIAIAGHRTDFPKTMGTIFWQVNDCWQAPTWSSIDYNQQWKALQYIAKKDYASVTILQQTKKIGQEKYFFVSDLNQTIPTLVNYEVFNLQGEKIYASKIALTTKPYEIIEISNELQENYFRNQDYFVKFNWKDQNNIAKERVFYHEVAKKRAKTKNENVQIQIVNHDKHYKRLSIEIKSSEILVDLWITHLSQRIHLTENFEHHFPGKKTYTIHYFDNELDLNGLQYFWR